MSQSSKSKRNLKFTNEERELVTKSRGEWKSDQKE